MKKNHRKNSRRRHVNRATNLKAATIKSDPALTVNKNQINFPNFRKKSNLIKSFPKAIWLLIGVFFTIFSGFVALDKFIQQFEPHFQSPTDISNDSPFETPFRIANPSAIFDMRDVQLRCVFTPPAILTGDMPKITAVADIIRLPAEADVPIGCSGMTDVFGGEALPTGSLVTIATSYYTSLLPWPHEAEPVSYAWTKSPTGKMRWERTLSPPEMNIQHRASLNDIAPKWERHRVGPVEVLVPAGSNFHTIE